MSMTCNGCGAAIDMTQMPITQCAYCGAAVDLNPPQQKAAAQADTTNVQAAIKVQTDINGVTPSYARIALNDATLQRQLQRHMVADIYAPDDLFSASQIVQRDFHYVPAYVFNIDYTVNWSAEFGFDHRESHTVRRTVTRDGSTFEEDHVEHRTVTHWRSASGVHTGMVEYGRYAGNAFTSPGVDLHGLIARIVDATNTFHYADAANLPAEAFTANPDNLFAALKPTFSQHVDHEVHKHAQGDHQRSWSWHDHYNYTSSPVYLPVAHTAFNYRGKTYHYWIDAGTTGAFAGTPLPVDKRKKHAVMYGHIPWVLATGAAALETVLWDFQPLYLGVVAALVGLHFLRKHSLLKYYKRLNEAHLLQAQATTAASNAPAVKKSLFANASTDTVILFNATLFSLAALMKLVTLN